MPTAEEARARLAGIPEVTVSTCVPLSRYTRFGIGGPADIFVETGSAEAFAAALDIARSSGLPTVVIGGGTNLIVSDGGFRGIVLRFRGDHLEASGDAVAAEAGAVLQDLVDFAIGRGLRGLETLAGIPGSVGAAVYGNAGAYGHSISECVAGVRFHDGRRIRAAGNLECGFEYRGSVFKRNRGWVIFSVDLRLAPGDAVALRRRAEEILSIRNEKFPAAMKCAGSIFKNLMVKDLPAEVAAGIPSSAVRDGKVAAAWFLEQAGAPGMARGDMRVAAYHANLIYNAGAGTAAGLCALIADLKARVRERFGIGLEEEVQYAGNASGSSRHLDAETQRY
jgi:UDP-N-acetylmuramate dehydrogenase